MVLKGLDIFSPEEFLEVLISVNWATKDTISLGGLKKAIDSSTQMYGIRNDKNELVALSRVLSDNYLFSTIPEILVKPSFQKQGFGRLLMNEIKQDFGHTVLYFGAQKGNEQFYESLGFDKGMQSYTKKFFK